MEPKDILKNAVKVGFAGAFLLGGLILGPALVGGWLALKAVDLASGLLGAVRGSDAAAKRSADRAVRAARAREARRRVYDGVRRQWNLDELPMDMTPSVAGGARSRDISFTCAGVKDIVRGRWLGGGRCEFSMAVDDARRAESMNEYIRKNGMTGASVTRTADGRFEIRSAIAGDINDIVKEFYPPVTMDFSRRVETVEQYVVRGCSTFEEAVSKLKEGKAHGAYREPDNVYVRYEDSVNDVSAGERVNGPGPMDVSEMEEGAFVVDASTFEMYERSITVNGPVDSTEAAMRSLVTDAVDAPDRWGAPAVTGGVKITREDDLVEDKCILEPTYGDALAGKQVRRYVESGLDRIYVDDVDRTMDNLYALVTLKDADELRDVMSGKKSLSDYPLMLTEGQPDMFGLAGFTVCVPLPREDALKVKAPFAVRDDGLPLSYGLVRALRSNGVVPVRLDRDIALDGALVNGVPVAEARQGLGGEGMDSARSAFWLSGAGRIDSVHIEVDVRRKELVLSSTVTTDNGMVTREKRTKLDDEQMRNVLLRDMPGKAELKDIVMKLYPEDFAVYRADKGSYKGLYADPVGDYITGRKPLLTTDVEAVKDNRQSAAKKTHKCEVKRNNMKR